MRILVITQLMLLLCSCKHELIQSSSSNIKSRNGVDSNNQSVVLIIAGSSNGTGVQIGPSTILSVNHVTAASSPNSIMVFPNYNPTARPKQKRVQDVKIFSQQIRSELSMIQLKEPHSLERYKTWTGPDSDLKIAQLYSFGYGVTDKADSPLDTQRRADLFFDSFCMAKDNSGDDQRCSSQSYPTYQDAMPILQLAPGPSNSISCRGDSGGPVIAQINGEEFLIGVLSHVVFSQTVTASTTSEEACSLVAFVRIIPLKPYAKWIASTSQEFGDIAQFSHPIDNIPDLEPPPYESTSKAEDQDMEFPRFCGVYNY